LLNGLLHHSEGLAGVARAGIVHRLDKDTTGLMVVAKTALAQTDLVRQLQARSVRREYLALVLGAPAESGSLSGAIGRHPRDRLKMAVLPAGATGAKPAMTHYRVLGRGRLGAFSTSLLALRLETGRTHQIRVHLSDAGHPIIGDQVYANPGAKSLFPRQALHAGRLGLIHPQTKLPCSFESAPPQDLADLIGAAGLAEALDDF
jgi:23S rRNA pseudouridine1911/1915/1917 synthase